MKSKIVGRKIQIGLNCYLSNFMVSVRTTLVPFGAKPYLCTSADIEVTPLTEKSKGGIGYLKEKYSVKAIYNIIVGYSLTMSSNH